MALRIPAALVLLLFCKKTNRHGNHRKTHVNNAANPDRKVKKDGPQTSLVVVSS
jgi:hypothetical protein